MHTRVITLPFSPSLSGFDERPLREAVANDHIIAFREHIVHVDGRPYVVCVVQTVPSTTSRPRQTDSNLPFPAAIEPPCSSPRRAASTSPRVDSSRERASTPDALPPLDTAQSRLYEQLRDWRRARAHSDGVPPYVVLTNRQLDAVVRLHPANKNQLAAIDGIGPAKLDRYGQELIELLGRPQPVTNNHHGTRDDPADEPSHHHSAPDTEHTDGEP